MRLHFQDELRVTFEQRAGRAALIHRNRTYSYAQLDRLARNGAALLQQHGMDKGDRVVLWTAAKFPFLVAHLAVLYGGGISLPLNPKFTREEMRHFLSDSGARLAVAAEEQFSVLESLQSETDLHALIRDTELAEAPAAPLRDPAPSADDPCLLVYSSGTTGWPKGVVHTNANVAASLHALGDCWRFTPDEVVVNVLPLFHIHGLSFATQLTFLVGGCVLLEDSFDPLGTLDVIGRGTVFMSVPTIWYRFLDQPAFPGKARSWSVRLFTCGSAPLRPDVLPGLQEILGRPLINRYGMTEAHVITSLPLDGPWPTGSVGLPLKGIELQVVNDGGQPVAAGEIGRVRVRGPNLFREYWRNPEATHKAFAPLTLPSPPGGEGLSSSPSPPGGEGGVRGGWFDTGDLGQLDDRGFLTLVGRSNQLIITNGYNVYPQVVERVVNACPGVREAAVFGIPDAVRGERVAVAVVRDDPTLDEDALRAFWGERLVDYQRPAVVFFLESLPRNAMGKVQLDALRQPWANSPRQVGKTSR